MRPAAKAAMPKAGWPQGSVRRCAIYTRKSSEEGLEQAFNSLDAQREACAAYVASQRHEGWVLLPTLYDDGGISGGTLERPALRQLLADIRAGKVDLVIVYKVDRLTRSLADFAKIVEVFDAQGASFVSVTQQFNTATSMGRLTLNMLLSFAQFEREVTGERIRDKIAASKRKGIWMGGVVPLGYDVLERKLVVNPAEAETVRWIFRRYLELGSVRRLAEALAAAGIRGKQRPNMANERLRGGGPLARGALYLILQNRLYRGEVSHQGQVYPGEHDAIIEAELWDAVQQHLAANRVQRETGARVAHPSLLAGLLYDTAGERLLPTHTVKSGAKTDRRYRYYVSKALQTGEAPAGATPASPLRLPAHDIERVVTDRLGQWLNDRAAVYAAIRAQLGDGDDPARLLARAAELAQHWNQPSAIETRHLIRRLLRQVTVASAQVDIHLDIEQLIAVLRGTEEATATSNLSPAPPPLILTVPVRLRRAGLEMRLLIDGGSRGPEPDRTLIRLIVKAQHLRQRLMTERLGVGELAASEGVTASYVSRVLRLAYLAPDILTAILTGRQPVGLTANKLANDSRLPIAWPEQRRVLGFTVEPPAA